MLPARNIGTLDELSNRENVRLLQLDVTAAEDALDEATAQAIGIFGRVDVLVNNAGYVLSVVLEEVRYHNRPPFQQRPGLFLTGTLSPAKVVISSSNSSTPISSGR